MAHDMNLDEHKLAARAPFTGNELYEIWFELSECQLALPCVFPHIARPSAPLRQHLQHLN